MSVLTMEKGSSRIVPTASYRMFGVSLAELEQLDKTEFIHYYDPEILDGKTADDMALALPSLVSGRESPVTTAESMTTTARSNKKVRIK